MQIHGVKGRAYPLSGAAMPNRVGDRDQEHRRNPDQILARKQEAYVAAIAGNTTFNSSTPKPSRNAIHKPK